MAENSSIEWTDHTFNPWRGCTKVSQGCKHCYANTLSKRNPKVLGVFGPTGTRPIAAEDYWKQPIRWNAEAGARFDRIGDSMFSTPAMDADLARRPRVFCASLADVFEDSTTMPPEAWLDVCRARERLFTLIEATPNLDWLLLTKRPHRVMEYVPVRWSEGLFPPNVWIGTSVEDQKTADERIPHLWKIHARVLFLSCEPLIAPAVLPIRPGEWRCPMCRYVLTKRILHASDFGVSVNSDAAREVCPNDGSTLLPNLGIDWVICGGESGPGARPMHPDWASSLRDQCAAAGVPFFFKQWGEWQFAAGGYLGDGAIAMWPDGHIATTFRETGGRRPKAALLASRVGKHRSGRILDGVTHDAYPAVGP